MREPFNTRITAFKSLYEPEGTPIDLTLDDIYRRIKKGFPILIDKINTIRTTKDSKLKADTKNSLLCIMFNGVFTERGAKGFKEHSGIAVLDFDKYPTPEIMEEERQRLIKDKHILIVFISPSGNGLKALIRIPKCNESEHKQRALTFGKYFNSPYFDKAQTTISQTCFESYDPNIFLNQYAEEFTEIETIEQAPINYTINKVNTIKTALSPFEDYNNRGDVVGLLQRHGWRFTNQVGPKVNLLRPGQTDTKHSGNFHTDLRTFSVFTTSTIFETTDNKGNKKAYSPSDVYSILECNGDKKITYRRLLEEGYGEPIDNKAIQPTQVKNISSKVEIVNKVTGVNRIISNTGDTIKIEDLDLTKEEIVYIIPTSETTTDEVLKLIELSSKRCYIIENGVELVSYRYQLKAITDRYSKEVIGDLLTDRQIDNLLTEIVETASKLEPIDKALFVKLFLDEKTIQNLGITQEALNITIDKITATKEKEQQKTEFNKLLKEVSKLQESGEINEALDLLDTRVKEVKLKDKITEFNSLLQPINETDLREHLTNKPESLNSGIRIGGEELLLPSGAISVFCAPTSHGKTSMLINLALNTAKEYKEKQVYLFSYEEDRESILIKALNTYLDTQLTGNNRTTLENYFSGKNKAILPAEKDTFFKELIETNRLNIVYSNYNSDTLIEAIRYLKKTTNVGAVFIDYIQLLNLPQGKYKTYSRQEELKNICISLKDIAVETGLPIIIGAQFNREVTTLLRIHATKIGEAGDIERIASLIVGFWNNNFPPQAPDVEKTECFNKVEYYKKGIKGESLYITILKNRGGRVGAEDVISFNGNTGKIKNSYTEKLPEY